MECLFRNVLDCWQRHMQTQYNLPTEPELVWRMPIFVGFFFFFLLFKSVHVHNKHRELCQNYFSCFFFHSALNTVQPKLLCNECKYMQFDSATEIGIITLSWACECKMKTDVVDVNVYICHLKNKLRAKIRYVIKLVWNFTRNSVTS